MTSENTQLLNDRKASISSKVTDKLRRSYKVSFFQSKGGIAVLVWISTILMAALLMIYSYPVLLFSFEEYTISVGLLLFVYISYPCLGYIGERFARHKLLIAGTILTVIGFVINLIILFYQSIAYTTSNNINPFLLAAWYTAKISSVCGYGLCYSNVLQFGITQLQFAPSSILEAYIRWLTLASLSTGIIPQLVAVLILKSVNLLLITNSACLTVMILVGAIIYAVRKNITLEAPPPIDPVKLIYKVMKYAWKYNYAVRPSAFTCSDGPPSRLDLAKTRYGGPFTTQQVEDVKSFWLLLLIPLSHVCNPALFISESLGNLCVKCLGRISSTFEIILLKSSIAITELVAVSNIVILQLVIVPCCSKRIPNLLKRMGIGLFLLLTSAIATTIISNNYIQNLHQTEVSGANNSTITCHERAWPYYVVIVPEVLSGIGLSISLTSQLEFIVAQAPHSMKGILIGITYIQFVFPYFTSFIGNITRMNENLYYYLFISFFQILVLTFYSMVAYKYRYRQPNELSDINFREKITEIFTRELNNNEKERSYYLSSETCT